MDIQNALALNEHWGALYWSRTPEFDAYAREHGDL